MNMTKECFNCPYGIHYFPKYAEVIPGPSTDALSKIAQEMKIYLVGGTCVYVTYTAYLQTMDCNRTCFLLHMQLCLHM